MDDIAFSLNRPDGKMGQRNRPMGESSQQFPDPFLQMLFDRFQPRFRKI
jgi:hypothetical protein